MHADSGSFNIQCNLQGCSRTFRNFYTYQNHIHAYHDTSSLELTSEQCGEETREQDRWEQDRDDLVNGEHDWDNGDSGDEVHVPGIHS